MPFSISGLFIEVVDSDLGIKMIIINTLVAVNAIYIYIFYNFHIDQMYVKGIDLATVSA
jgi:hypothetical protein